MHSLGREPAGCSETWPRPGIAGHRPLAGDGASRRPKVVSNPGNTEISQEMSPWRGRQILMPTGELELPARDLSGDIVRTADGTPEGAFLPLSQLVD